MASFGATADGLEQVAVAAVAVIVAVSSVGLSRSRYDLMGARCFGLALPIVPWIGPYLLLASGLFFFALRPAQSAALLDSTPRTAGLLWIMPFLGLLVGTLVGETISAAGLLGPQSAGVLSQVRIDGLMRATDLIRALLEVHLPTWAISARVLFAGLVVSFFSSNSEAMRGFVMWLRRGCAVLALYVIVQYLTARYSGSMAIPWVLWKLPNQTPLWDALGRPSGLVTDPNALGVVLALTLWIAFLLPTPERPSWPGLWPGLSGLWSGLLLVAGFVSGSRTFLLSIALLLALLVWRERRGRLLWSALGVVAAAVIAVTLLDSYSGLVGQLVASEGLPMGLRRGVAALSLMRLEETFMSRGVFLDLASAIGAGNWLFGVGADRFIDYVPLIGAEQNIVRGWKDNSNNLYVGIATELGLVGAGLFICVLLGRRVRSPEQRAASMIGMKGEQRSVCALWCLVMLGILGFTGPHTDFIEVLMLVGLLVAVTTEQRSLSGSLSRRFWGAIACAAVVVGGIASWYHEQGVYGWNNTTFGASRWLSHTARITALCERGTDSGPRVSLLLQPQYIPQREPLRVTVTVTGQVPHEALFRSTEVQDVTLPCSIADGNLMSDQVAVHISTSPAWSPYRAWPRTSGDRRILGVQQLFRSNNAGGRL